MDSKSQAGQDVFVFKMLGEPTTPGSYLEIGASDPIENNNTYNFDKMGWSGLSIDIDESHASKFAEFRKNPFLVADATKVDWQTILGDQKLRDYLSFDVDEASHDTFIRFPFDVYEFKVITIEHDRYRFGDVTRNIMRNRLSRQGYQLICSDVRINGGMFEDWWVNPKHVNMDYAFRFICSGEEYQRIITAL